MDGRFRGIPRATSWQRLVARRGHGDVERCVLERGQELRWHTEEIFQPAQGSVLRRKEVSKLLSEYLGCPILALTVRTRDTKKALRRPDPDAQGADGA